MQQLHRARSLTGLCCRTPRGLEDVGGYPRLFSLLLEQGEWTEAQLHKLAGLNLLRVLRNVEKVRVSHGQRGVG